MRIHPEGRPFLTLALLLVAGATGASWLWLPAGFAALVSAGLLALMGFLVQFFRHPHRQIPEGNDHLVSPADGKVVVMERVYEPAHLKRECLQLSVFMGPFDVHLNRIPIDGRLAYYHYYPGAYLAAYNPKSSSLNEQNAIGWESRHGTILLKQIAGVMARRIRFYLQEGAEGRKGEQLGFIKFGSRMDILLPLDATIPVKVGQQVYAGETILACWSGTYPE